MHAISLGHLEGILFWLGLGPRRKFALPLGSHFWYTLNMKKSISVHKKARGRPATGRDPAVTIRLPEKVLALVERWAMSQNDQPPRSQAIRRLVELGLSRSTSPKRPRLLSTAKQGASRAAELAADVIGDQMPNTSNEEKATRRRRLIKGPSEFRNVRRDRL
jgi:hypothetical protein